MRNVYKTGKRHTLEDKNTKKVYSSRESCAASYVCMHRHLAIIPTLQNWVPSPNNNWYVECESS